MKKVDGSITSYSTDATSEEAFFTYSEAEKQENAINSATAKVVFTPEFIPYHLAIKKKYGLTDSETLLYGFIRFYIGTTQNRFYFSNEQLASMLDSSVPTITRSMKRLSDIGLMEIGYRIKSGGGQIRFVSSVFMPTNQNDESDSSKRLGNKNKVKDNINILLPKNIKTATRSSNFLIPKTGREKSYGDPTVNYILALWAFWKKEEGNDSERFRDKFPRYIASTIAKQLKKGAINGDPVTFVAFLFFWWLVMQRQYAFSNSKNVLWAQQRVKEFLGEYYADIRHWNGWDYNKRTNWLNGFGVFSFTEFEIRVVQNGITPEIMALS